MKKVLSLCFSIFLVFNLLSQSSAHRKPGELIVRLEKQVSAETFMSTVSRLGQADVSLKKTIAPTWNILHLMFDESTTSPEEILSKIQRVPGVLAAQFNYRLAERTTIPNDPNWDFQWGLEKIGATSVWDATTGGLTMQGDTIVVAVLEKGADLSHTDLLPNVWFNWNEIPDNNKDDDGNGYIDDFRGWNPRLDNDEMVAQNHGTVVNGIIGAKGNNNKGVSGTNWNIKLMNLANVEYEVAEIIPGYEYVYKMRDLYNKTNGQKGAFVVATNASFGIDFAQAVDHKMWCDIYDDLGQVGVLSIAATANLNIDVEEEGDMPTTCGSEYLIAVTSTNQQDEKHIGTAWGKTSIDLAAPGVNIQSTAINNTYSALTGTSVAAPHVAGAIGLFYSMKCESLAADALTAPANCAARFRELILKGAVPLDDLKDITKTGSRLDLNGTMNQIVDLCGGSTGDLEIVTIKLDPASTGLVEVYYETPDFEFYDFRVFNMLGQLMYEKKFKPDPFTSKKVVFDAGHFANGIYTIAINREKNKVARQFRKL